MKRRKQTKIWDQKRKHVKKQSNKQKNEIIKKVGGHNTDDQNRV